MSAFSVSASLMDERYKAESATAAGGGGGAAVSLSELLGLVVTPSDQQQLQQQQQIQMPMMQMNPDRRAMGNAATGMGNFLDELILDNWDDDDDEHSNDSNDDCGELFLHGNAGDASAFLGMEAFSSAALLEGAAAAAAPTTPQDAVPTPAFMVSTALNSSSNNSSNSSSNNSHTVTAAAAVSGPPSQNKKPRLTSSSSSSSDRNKVAIAPPKKHATSAPTAFVPGKTRMRRKLEIQLLKEESEKLQQKHQNLREYWKLASNAVEQASWAKSDKNRSMQAALVRAESMWKPIAARQRDALNQSERENQDLKAQFLLQRKMLQRIRKLIMKRVNTAKKMQTEIKLKPAPSPQFLTAACTSTFDKLLADSVSMYMDVGKVQRLFQMRDTKKQIFREWAVKQDSVGSDLRLEMVDSHVTPFNRTQVGQELLRSYGVQALEKKKDIGEYFQSSDNTIVRQYISSFNTQNAATGQGVVRVKQVIRTFADENQSVFVINTVLERLAEDGTTSNQIRAKKWVVVRSCSNGLSTGAGAGAGSGLSSASSIQSYYTMKPEAADKGYGASWCKPMLEDILVPILDVGTTASHQELENALIEQSRKMPKLIGINAH